MTKMYIICRYNLLNGKRTVCDILQSPSEAYEKAHGLDAVLRFGRSDEDMWEKINEPFVVDIENEYGQSVWRECCKARCPSNCERLFV